MPCRLDGDKPFFWTNAGILLIEPLGTNFSEILIAIYVFSFKKMHSKMSENGGHFVSASMSYLLLSKGEPWTIIQKSAKSVITFVVIFKFIFLYENRSVSIGIVLQFVPKGTFNRNAELFQILACRWLKPRKWPWEAIIRINYGIVYWRMYASPGVNELSHQLVTPHGVNIAPDNGLLPGVFKP